MSKTLVTFLLIGLVLGVGCTATFYQLLGECSAKEIVVFASAAAAPVYKEAAGVFESKYGVKVAVNLGWFRKSAVDHGNH